MASESRDAEMKAALAAGWRRSDVWWERTQELANAALADGDFRRAIGAIRCARFLGLWSMPRHDPRRVTGLANAACAARLLGREDMARRRYAAALDAWARLDLQIAHIELRPRARSSLFHMRMEARHRDVYRLNMEARLTGFVREAGECLAALSRGEPPPHRLYARWRGERPAMFDGSRKLLAACLLIANRDDVGRSIANR